MGEEVSAALAYGELAAAGVVVAIGGAGAAALVSGVHADHVSATVVVFISVSLVVGLASAWGAWRSKELAVTGPALGSERFEPRGPEPRPRRDDSRRPAPVAAGSGETSPMEDRMTDSLKSIMAQAEQGLFASDAEKARHLEMIWSMAACDLDDDGDLVTH